MRVNTLSIGVRVTSAIFAVALLVTGALGAAKETVLHNFKDNHREGATPNGFIFDTAGNFYGTTEGGGSGACKNGNIVGCGTVFELTPKAGGGWTEKVLHSFNLDGKDGYNPESGLVSDAIGNLYGTTFFGGVYNSGTVFELTPKAGGGWTEKIVHNFNDSGKDGYYPSAGLIVDASGNLYGTTETGGKYTYGTVFELTPKAGGGWTEKVLHSFNLNGTDGYDPIAGLIFDAAGNLYGTTLEGGAHDSGTVFELTIKSGGGWTEKILCSFNGGNEGLEPLAGLIFDASGNLYGTTNAGGAYGFGTVFELMPKAGGGWTEKVLHSFNDSGKDGFYPWTGLIFDAAHNLYGTTAFGGSGSCNDDGIAGCGTVFELTPKVGGSWAEKILHSFDNNGNDGNYPAATLIFGSVGSLYGTTEGGGAYGFGTVFKITH